MEYPPHYLRNYHELKDGFLQTDINKFHFVLNTGCQPKSKYLTILPYAYDENVYVADRTLYYYLCCSSSLCVVFPK